MVYDKIHMIYEVLPLRELILKYRKFPYRTRALRCTYYILKNFGADAFHDISRTIKAT